MSDEHEHACEVCGNWPDEHGILEHGKGATMTPDQLRAAAEGIIASYEIAGEQPHYLPAYAVAKAYLAEHPADDEEVAMMDLPNKPGVWRRTADSRDAYEIIVRRRRDEDGNLIEGPLLCSGWCGPDSVLLSTDKLPRGNWHRDSGWKTKFDKLCAADKQDQRGGVELPTGPGVWFHAATNTSVLVSESDTFLKLAATFDNGYRHDISLLPRGNWHPATSDSDLRAEVERLREIIYQSCSHVMPGLENTPDSAANLPLSCKRLVDSEHDLRAEVERLGKELAEAEHKLKTWFQRDVDEISARHGRWSKLESELTTLSAQLAAAEWERDEAKRELAKDLGDVNAQARAWAAVRRELVEAGMERYLSSDGTGKTRAVEHVRRMASEIAKATARAEAAERERDEARKDAAAWKEEWQMYANAWKREVSGFIPPKTHLIDALVLATRELKKRHDDAIAAKGAADGQ